ncbi:hypothetical protein BGZ57DRAFT_936062 [Hyaloscypha finlandica]|nr:hypothetical protein BGZ57DRAFT_936062 [Hyaloscypha finlandica]
MVLHRDQSIALRYIKWNEIYAHGVKPFQMYSNLPEDQKGLPESNVCFEEGTPCLVRNLRGMEDHFDIDKHGFSFARVDPVSFMDWKSAPNVVQDYYPQVVALLKRHILAADHVHIFQHRVCSTSQLSNGPNEDIVVSAEPSFLKPAATVHVDLSRVEVSGLIANLAADGHDKVGGHSIQDARVRVINVWRPLFHPADDWPLALCDGSTVKEEDILAVQKIRTNRKGEGLCPLYRSHYKWYFLEGQGVDEVLFLKNFDSLGSVEAKFAPHAAFRPQNLRPNAPPRSSIEVRALVFSNP